MLNSLTSEWLKTRRSAASWLCIIGGFFLPLLYLIGFLKDHSSINAYPLTHNSWEIYFYRIWQFMAILLLPMGLILAASLVTQMEFRNNTWKQVHVTPQHFTVIYFSKLLIILLLTLQFFLYFNIGLAISAILPSLLFDHRWPRDPFPLVFYLKANGRIFLTCLPILAIQFIISLRARNFLVPIGFGLMALVGAIILINAWKYAWIIPYSYTAFPFTPRGPMLKGVNIYALATGYFVVFTIAGYIIYITRNDKG